MQGRVMWLARAAAFGFVRPDGAKADAFFHGSILSDEDYRKIEVGSRLEFELVPAKDGKQKAVGVRLI